MQDKWPGIWNEPLSELERMKVEHAMYHAWRKAMLDKFIWQAIALMGEIILLSVMAGLYLEKRL